MSKKFERKIAVITGGSTSMSLATAKRFVQEGMDHVFIEVRAAVDVSHSLRRTIESVDRTGQSRRSPHGVLSKRRSAPGHQLSAGNAKLDSFDHRSLSETVRLAQQGDAAAFEAVYRLHSGRVYALCLRMVHSAVEAEDLTQEVFMQVFRKLNSFRGESAFSTWLHRVAVNLILMHLRKKSPPTVCIDVTDGQDDEIARQTIDVGAPDLQLEGSIDRLRLERCIEQLPAGYRAIFVLHDIQGYDHNEIAKMVGRSVGNSKSQLHKARMRLRELLREIQREKTRKERLSSRKRRSQLWTSLPPLTAVLDAE